MSHRKAIRRWIGDRLDGGEAWVMFWVAWTLYCVVIPVLWCCLTVVFSPLWIPIWLYCRFRNWCLYS